MRDGRQYISSLKDGRTVYIDGKKVSDVTSHPAFRGIVDTIAGMYDFSANPGNGMICETGWGTKGNKIYMIPTSLEELLERHEAIEKLAAQTAGFVGRGPDHVGGFLAGFAGNKSKFAGGARHFERNVVDFYRKVVDQDLYVTYAIVPPQTDKTKAAHEKSNRFSQVGVSSENGSGIVVKGAQMLATGGAVSDYVFVSCIHPLKQGDEDYAISFVVPSNAKGLKFHCRRSYAPGKPSTFDYPLSTRFDESDAFLVFDDVFIPWEDVFVFRNVALMHDQFFETPAHVLGNNQAQIRLLVKLKFILGIAKKVAGMNGSDRIPGVIEKLGEMASLVSIIEGMVVSSECRGMVRPEGVFSPNPRFLYGAIALQSELYPRVLHLLRDISGAGILQLPSSFEDLLNPETSGDLSRYIVSPNHTSEERIKLFKLAWDIVGSEFAGRHYQYEMFYAGAPFIAKSYAFWNYGFDEVEDFVDDFMSKYDFRSGSKQADGKAGKKGS